MPIVDVADLFRRSKRKCLSGFPAFSGPFFKIPIFGLEKVDKHKIVGQEIENRRGNFTLTHVENFHLVLQDKTTMTSGLGRQSVFGAPFVSD